MKPYSGWNFYQNFILIRKRLLLFIKKWKKFYLLSLQASKQQNVINIKNKLSDIPNPTSQIPNYNRISPDTRFHISGNCFLNLSTLLSRRADLSHLRQ